MGQVVALSCGKSSPGLQFNPGSTICELTLSSPFNSAPPGVKQVFSPGRAGPPSLAQAKAGSTQGQSDKPGVFPGWRKLRALCDHREAEEC